MNTRKLTVVTAIAGILALGGGSVTLSVLGPRLLGDATTLIFSGVLGRSIPAGVTKAQAVAQLRSSGKGTLADLLNATPVARRGARRPDRRGRPVAAHRGSWPAAR